jgi:hypothetical protein
MSVTSVIVPVSPATGSDEAADGAGFAIDHPFAVSRRLLAAADAPPPQPAEHRDVQDPWRWAGSSLPS